MFDGGKNTPAPQEKKDASSEKDSSVRVFVMPEELRSREAVFVEEKQDKAPEALQPIIVPVPLPASDQPPVIIKKRVSPVLIVLLVLVLMGGTGAGVWWYVSTYAAPPQVTEPPEPTPDPTPVPDPVPQDPYPGTDTDSDGLTNVEELLYGTDFRSPDTDGDTFLDGNEVFHRYDPNGLAPSTLLDTGAVRVLERTDLPFTLFYPASWTVSAASNTPEVTFRSAENGSITLAYEEKESLTGLDVWMKAKGISLKSTETTMTKEGYTARNAQDGRTVYVDLGAWAVSAQYDLGDTLSIEFLQTFKMMMNSVRILETHSITVPLTGSSAATTTGASDSTTTSNTATDTTTVAGSETSTSDPAGTDTSVTP